MRNRPASPVRKFRPLRRLRELVMPEGAPTDERSLVAAERSVSGAPPKVAVIVPALNEGARIGGVLQALTQADCIDEIIVVSDGSTDNTPEVARGFEGVKVVELERNLGKGGAMFEGVSHTDADILVFIDADLRGLRSEQVTALIRPVYEDGAAMSIGVFRGGRLITDLSQRLVSCVSGQRAVSREVFLTVPAVRNARMGVEIALTTHAKINQFRVARVFLDGVTHPMKEEKLGLAHGVAGRLKMYWEIGAYVAHAKLLHRRNRVVQWLNENGRRRDARPRLRLIGRTDRSRKKNK